MTPAMPGTPYLLQCSEPRGLPTNGLPEAHGGEFGQGARICDQCLDLWWTFWWRPRWGPMRQSGTRAKHAAFRSVVSVLVTAWPHLILDGSASVDPYTP